MSPATVDQLPLRNAGSSVPRPLEFVTITTMAPARRDTSISKAVRTQAMKDYMWKQNHPSAIGNTPPVKNATEGALQYKGRFRLSSRPTKKDMAASKGRSVKRMNVGAAKGRPYLIPSPLAVLGGSLDPFDSFSLKLRPESQRLILYYHQGYSMNTVALGLGHCMDVAVSDLALFHAVLYLVALDYNLKRGETDDLGCLYHNVEACRLISQRIQQGIFTDTTIAAIAIIATKENLAGMFDVSELHMKGLEHIVQQRGGIEAIEGLHRRVVIWSDFCNSNIRGSPPAFPRLVLQEDVYNGWPDDVGGMVLSPNAVFGASSRISRLFESLRYLSVSLDSSPPLLDAASSRNRIYDLEYELQLLKTGASTQNMNSWLSTENTTSTLTSDAIPFSIAITLYLYLVIREIPGRSQLIHQLVQRLQEALVMQPTTEPDADYEKQIWSLWIIFIGYGASVGFAEEPWFADELQKLATDTDKIEVALRSVLWQGKWSSYHCQRLKRRLERQ